MLLLMMMPLLGKLRWQCAVLAAGSVARSFSRAWTVRTPREAARLLVKQVWAFHEATCTHRCDVVGL